MGSRRPGLLLLVLFLMPSYGCRSDGISPATMRQIRQAQDRMLTVDGRIAAGAGARLFSRMHQGGLDAAFLFVTVPQGDPTPAGRQAARDAAMRGIDRVKRLVESRSRFVSLALAPEDAYRLEKEGRHAVFLGLEASGAIGGDVSAIREFRRAGVRCLKLGGADNDIGGSAFGTVRGADPGLSEFGRRVVEHCNRAGLIIDAADCSERTLADALATSRAPVVVSRGAARALCNRPGNLTDGMIRAIADAGGVVLVSFEPGRLVAGARPARVRATVSHIVDNIEHIVRVAGAAGVGIGSGFGDGGGVARCRDAGDILNLTVELLRRGFTEHEIEAIWGGNLMRVFRRVEDVAAGR